MALSPVSSAFWVSVALCVAPVTCYKVLFIPAPVGSHVVLLSSVADSWAAAGHEAHVLKHHSIAVPSQFKNSGIVYVDHGRKGEMHLTVTPEFTQFMGSINQKGFMDVMSFGNKLISYAHKSFLEDDNLIPQLKKNKYDFVVVDNFPGGPVLPAVAYKLGVPYGILGVVPPLGAMSLTLQTNYLGTSIPIFYSKEPSFVMRFVQFLSLQAMGLKDYLDSAAIIDYLKDRPLPSDDVSLLWKYCRIWLVDSEPFVDAPKHSAPNVIYVGGISAGPSKPLPTDLQKYADSAKDGLIVVSYGGSTTAEFPESEMKELLTGLGAVKQKVIIRLKSKPQVQVGSNVLISKWLPQNDLLGHPNTVLFITHCGMSSVNEGVYHGVPMLGFPGQPEQRNNAVRFTDKHYGLHMDRKNFTSNELKSTIGKMLQNTEIKNTIKKASMIIQSRRFNARQESVYWIEHVIKFGGDHLVPATAQLAWYQVLLYDIALAIVLIVAAIVYIFLKCCQCARRLCCGKKAQPKKKTS